MNATASFARAAGPSPLGADAAFDHTAGLVAPAAVRLLDLDAPLADLSLWSERRGRPYRSLLVVGRLDGEPLGATAVPVSPAGWVSAGWLAQELRERFEVELDDAPWPGPDPPQSPLTPGIAGRLHNGRPRKVKRRSVSVVVTTRHDPVRLERCLRSVLACDYPELEVIVVENGRRSNATMRMLGERFHDEPRLRYVEEGRGGLTRARNAGLARAEGDVVMFTDDDVVVDPGWVRRCAESFDRKDDVVCVTGLVLPLELETDGQLLFERFASFAKGFGRTTFRLPQERTTHPFFYYTPGAIGSGGNTALRADVARRLGGFDTTLGAGTPARGGEDVDVYARLLSIGHTVVYDPSVIVWHEHPEDLSSVRREVLGRGIALGAVLAKQVAAGPERRALLRAVPAGVRYELHPRAHPGRQSDEPRRGLDWLGWLGLAIGPAAYAASALRTAVAQWARAVRWGGDRTTASRSERALVGVAVAACLIAPLLVAAGVPSQLRLAAVLALLCLAPGTALVSALAERGTPIEPGLAIGASLATSAVLAQSMLWLGTWWPKAWLYALAAACLPPLLVRLRAGGRTPDRRQRDGATPDASGTWVTEVELGRPLSDLHSPLGPGGACPRCARILVRLHRQPIGFVELPLEGGTVAARDLVTAIDAQFSAALAAHLSRDGLGPATLTTKGLPRVKAPRCAASGFYGETEPFVSVLLTAPDGPGDRALHSCLRSLLAVDYPAFEVVVARRISSGKDPLRHPWVRYVDAPEADAESPLRHAITAASGDVLVFADSGVVVDSEWLRTLVRGLTPAARVGCVTGGGGVEPGVSLAVSREALDSVGAFGGIGSSGLADGRAGDALMQRLLLAGWAVSHEPAALAWRLTARDRADAVLPLERLREAAGRIPVSVPVHAAVLSAALGAWAASLLGADLSRIGGVGLLSAMPPTYFLAFALLLFGFTIAVTRDKPDPRLLATYVLALVLVLHGTTPLLYDEPRYAWSYKHLGVIALIANTGAVDRYIDIYNNWPAFFAANAWLSRTAGVAAIAYAGWAQLFFNVVNVLAVRFALRGLTRDERLLWTATLFFVLGNWVGQDYLSPQAFGFVLTLVVLGLCLRCGPAPDDDLPPAPLGPRGALIVGGLCFLAVVTSHQLSPVLLILSVAAISVVARRVPLWIPVAMLAIEFWWVWLSWPFVKDHFSLIDPGPAGAAAVGRDIHSALPGAVLSFYAPAAVAGLIAVLALYGAARRFRAGERDIVPVCLIVAPLLGIGLQSYGGEGGNRAYLFALPWLAFFAAAACARPPVRSGVVRMRFASVAVATGAVGACLLFAYFGQELANHIGRDDVRADTWYEQHAPPGSIRVVLAPNAPERLTARYPLTSLNTRPPLVQRPAFRGHLLGVGDVARLKAVVEPLTPTPTFVMLSQGQEDYGRLNGLLPKGSVGRLARELDATAAFRLVYRRPSAWIFEFVPRSPR
jgi:GT2 family glycosyltransferase